MDFKKVLIGVAVIGVAYYFYNKSKKSASTTSTEGGETSSANGAQLLAIAKNGGSTGWSGATGSGTWVMCAGIKTWCPAGETNCCARSRTAVK